MEPYVTDIETQTRRFYIGYESFDGPAVEVINGPENLDEIISFARGRGWLDETDTDGIPHLSERGRQEVLRAAHRHA
jgi:hypothetical protein